MKSSQFSVVSKWTLLSQLSSLRLKCEIRPFLSEAISFGNYHLTSGSSNKIWTWNMGFITLSKHNLHPGNETKLCCCKGPIWQPFVTLGYSRELVGSRSCDWMALVKGYYDLLCNWLGTMFIFQLLIFPFFLLLNNILTCNTFLSQNMRIICR